MNRFHRLIFSGCLISACLATSAGGQTVSVERPEVSGQPAPAWLDSSHLKDRPYGGNLPRPAYPSTERVQREFVVQYVYDYAYSAYNPAVSIPNQPRQQVDRSTPEGALTALFSAMRSGDYEGWLACWDEQTRSQLVDTKRQDYRDPASWQKAWKNSIAGKEISLIDRIETVNYIILDFRFAGTSVNAPIVFKAVKGQWFATNELRDDQMLMNFRPTLAAIRNGVSPESQAGLIDGFKQEGDAQRVFLDSHTYRAQATLPGR
jgi:hypothetical protein